MVTANNATISPLLNIVCSLLRLLLLRKIAFRREGSGAEVAIMPAL